jgi:hypothetical protein
MAISLLLATRSFCIEVPERMAALAGGILGTGKRIASLGLQDKIGQSATSWGGWAK